MSSCAQAQSEMVEAEDSQVPEDGARAVCPRVLLKLPRGYCSGQAYGGRGSPNSQSRLTQRGYLLQLQKQPFKSNLELESYILKAKDQHSRRILAEQGNIG